MNWGKHYQLFSARMRESSNIDCILNIHLPQRLHWLEDRGVDILVWTPALNTTSVEWHTWHTEAKAAAFTAVKPTKERRVHKTWTLSLSCVALISYVVRLTGSTFCIFTFTRRVSYISLHSLSRHHFFPYIPPLADYNIKLSHKSNWIIDFGKGVLVC